MIPRKIRGAVVRGEKSIARDAQLSRESHFLASLTKNIRIAVLASAGLITVGSASAAAAAVSSGSSGTASHGVSASAMADALTVKAASKDHASQKRPVAAKKETARKNPAHARAAVDVNAHIRKAAHHQHVVVRAETVNLSPQQIAQGMLAGYGWSGDQWSYLYSLWERESTWSTSATNPSSGAYGIPQALPASQMASAGPNWQNDPATQIKWGLNYIKQRYGSPAAAWAHEQSNGWY
jgi:hypothetical protein